VALSVREELETFARVRQFRHESAEGYRLRLARAIQQFMSSASERLTPLAYAWAKSASQRMVAGQHPLDFEDPAIRPSLSSQLFDYLSAEDRLKNADMRSHPRSAAKKHQERRHASASRIGRQIVSCPKTPDVEIAKELCLNGWACTDRQVSRARAKLRESIYILKDSGFQVLGPDGSRLVV